MPQLTVRSNLERPKSSPLTGSVNDQTVSLSCRLADIKDMVPSARQIAILLLDFPSCIRSPTTQVLVSVDWQLEGCFGGWYTRVGLYLRNKNNDLLTIVCFYRFQIFFEGKQTRPQAGKPKSEGNIWFVCEHLLDSMILVLNGCLYEWSTIFWIPVNNPVWYLSGQFPFYNQVKRLLLLIPSE